MTGQLILKIAGWALALLVLLAVFGLYGRPEFMFRMANQVWSCF